MLVALDSNIMVYAEGINDQLRQEKAQSLIQTLGPDRIVLPVQAIGEMIIVQMRVAKREAEFATARARDWRSRHRIQETTGDVLENAMQIVASHKFQFWDAVILSAASCAGASILLSEDMHSGFTWGGTTIVNPFILSPTEVLEFMSLATRH